MPKKKTKTQIPRNEFRIAYDESAETLEVTGLTKAAALAVNKAFKLVDPEEDPHAFIAYLDNPTPAKPKGNWVPCSHVCSYAELVRKRVFNWTGPFDHREVHLDGKLEVVRYAHHIVVQASIEPDGKLFIQGYGERYDRDAHYAQRQFAERVDEDFAHRPLTREYIETANGLYKYNPKYGTGHREPLQNHLPQYPNDVCVAVYDALWQRWWDREFGTVAQRDALRNIAGYEGREDVLWPTLRDYTLYTYDKNGTCDYHGDKSRMVRVLKPEEFRALK